MKQNAYALGAHLSFSKGFLHMGREAAAAGMRTMQFFLRNPRGAGAKPLDEADAAALRDFLCEHSFAPVVAHAPYTLNVSSPGLDRPFKTARDYERNLGKEVEVKLYAPLKGKKLLEGILDSFDETTVTIVSGGEQLRLPLNRIAKIHKAIKFD